MFGIICLLLLSSASATRSSAVPAGSKIWSFITNTSADCKGLGDCYRVGTPAVSSDGKMVYVGSVMSNSRVDAVDALTGRKKWGFQGDARLTSAPTVVVNSNGTSVYVGIDERVSAFDALDGRKIWSIPNGNKYGIVPEITVSSDGNVMYMISPLVEYCHLTAVRASDGRTFWSIPVGREAGASTMALSSDDKVVYAVSGSANPTKSALYAFDTSKHGNKIWSFTLGFTDVNPGRKTGIYSGPAVSSDGKMVYVSCNYKDIMHLCAIDTSNGKLIWRIETSNEKVPYLKLPTPAVSSDSKVVYTVEWRGPSSDHHQFLYLYAHNTLDGSTLWSYVEKDADIPCQYSTPVVSSDDKVVYIWCLSEKLQAVDTLTGSKIWSFETGRGGAGGTSDPAPVPVTSRDSKVVYVGSPISTLFAISAIPAPTDVF